MFERVHALPHAEREVVLDELCADDDELRREAEALLAGHDEAESAGADPLLRAAEHAWRDVTTSGAAAIDPHGDDELPEHIGRYRITGEIAHGGVGVVFRGEDDRIGREVALKVLRARHGRDAALARRLLEEGRIGGRLQHPGIVPVYELGDGARPYVAMKVVEGRTLASLLRERSDPGHDRQRFLNVFEHACQAIAFAHSKGVIHRDLKPHNLMVGAFGEVQVMDWGLAKIVGERSDPVNSTTAETALPQNAHVEALSLAGSVLGTPAYMAPEQARGEIEALDSRTDVFGLGAILCEILTGQPPFTGSSTGEVLKKARDARLDEALARLRDSEADPEVVRLAERCLSAERDDRPSDAGVVAGELRAHFDSTQERARRAELAAATERTRAIGERKARRLTTALGGIVMLALVIGGGAWLLLEDAARRRVQVAETRVRNALLEAERLASSAGDGPRRDLPTYEAALVSANSAREAAEGTSIDPELGAEAEATAARLKQQLEELRFLDELDRISTDYRFIDMFDRRAEAGAYREAFDRHLGRPFEEMSSDDAVRILGASRYREQILVAMDVWAQVEVQIDPDSQRLRRILAVADALDDDPWRRRIRAAIGERDRVELRRLAESDEAESASASTIYLLALNLMHTNAVGAALELLHANYDRFPDDYWINHTLSILHLGHTSEYGMSEALRFATAARALRPMSPGSYTLLADCYSRRGDYERALELARKAVEFGDDNVAQTFWVGHALFYLGRYEEALRSFVDCHERCPRDHSFYPLAAAWLGNARLHVGDADGAIDAWRMAVSTPFSHWSDPALAVLAPELQESALRAAEAAVERTRRQDAPFLFVLGCLLQEFGRWREALETFEDLRTIDPDSSRAANRIRDLRRAFDDPLTGYRAIDDAVDALPEDLDLGRARDQLMRMVRAAGADEDTTLRSYLDGRLLERAGRHADAAERFASVVDADHGLVEAWNLLHRCLRETLGPEEADARIAARLASGALPPRPIEGSLRAPVALAPVDGERPGQLPIVLTTTPLAAVDPRTRGRSIQWEVREAVRGPFERTRAVLVHRPAVETRLELPPGVLEADKTYEWRVRYATEAEATTPWSEPARFVAPASAGVAVAVEISHLFDRDVVIDPGDDTNDWLDAPNRFALPVEGFDGRRSGVDTAQGLPEDRRVGVHRLGDYSRPNALELEARPQPPIRIELPPGHYSCLRILTTSVNGGCALPLSITYEDGTVERCVTVSSDWFESPQPDALECRVPGVPAIDGMDRIGEQGLDDRNEAALFDSRVPADPARRALAVVFYPHMAQPTAARTRTFLFAITAMSSAD